MRDATVGETDVHTVRIYTFICVFIHSNDTRLKKAQSDVFLVLLVARRCLLSFYHVVWCPCSRVDELVCNYFIRSLSSFSFYLAAQGKLT